MAHSPSGSPFPADFLWGAGTSAYQLEGAVTEDGRGVSIWDQFVTTPGAIAHGDTGAVACDHYHRVAEDVDLMARLGLTAYRFSVAWPRVVPEGVGAVNGRGLDFYDRLVDTLLARDIAPVLTLYHWDLPLALHERGGWLNRATADAFADYAEIVARRLGDRVVWWQTLNEPWCSAYLGYGNGYHAPGLRDPAAAFVAGHHLLLAHGQAMERLRAVLPATTHVGIALNLNPVYAADDTLATSQAVTQADRFNNRWFLDPIFRGAYPAELFADQGVPPPPILPGDLDLIRAPLDFLAINYYSRALIPLHQGTSPVGATPIAPDHQGSYTAMGWEIYPRGLTDLLTWVDREYHPPRILVTENGAAFPDEWDGGDTVADPHRQAYIADHVAALGVAALQGVPLAGYFVWSLMDNFEWVDGYSQRFGVVYVDFPTQRRIIKGSGHWYAAFIAAQRAALILAEESPEQRAP